MKCLPAPLLLAALLAVAAELPAVGADKKIITGHDQLPARLYPIPRLPSELLESSRIAIGFAASALDRDLADDLEALDIRDAPLRQSMLQSRAQIAIFNGDFPAAITMLKYVRTQQDKDAEKHTSGVLYEQILQVRIAGGTLEEQRAQLKKALEAAWGAMPWVVVSENLKSTRDQLVGLSKVTTLESVRNNLDPIARSTGMNVPPTVVAAVVGIRNQLEHLLPFRDEIIGSLQAVMLKNRPMR